MSDVPNLNDLIPVPKKKKVRKKIVQTPESVEQEIVSITDKGFDPVPEVKVLDPEGADYQDFSVPLNGYYRELLEQVAMAIAKQVKLKKVSRRSIAARGVTELLDALAEEHKINLN